MQKCVCVCHVYLYLCVHVYSFMYMYMCFCIYVCMHVVMYFIHGYVPTAASFGQGSNLNVCIFEHHSFQHGSWFRWLMVSLSKAYFCLLFGTYLQRRPPTFLNYLYIQCKLVCQSRTNPKRPKRNPSYLPFFQYLGVSWSIAWVVIMWFLVDFWVESDTMKQFIGTSTHAAAKILDNVPQ